MTCNHELLLGRLAPSYPGWAYFTGLRGDAPAPSARARAGSCATEGEQACLSVNLRSVRALAGAPFRTGRPARSTERQRLQALIVVLLAAGGLTAGSEREEAEVLWNAVLRDAPRMHTAMDEVWLAGLVAEHVLEGASSAPGTHAAGRDTVETARRITE